jgi:hypothetical protein
VLQPGGGGRISQTGRKIFPGTGNTEWCVNDDALHCKQELPVKRGGGGATSLPGTQGNFRHLKLIRQQKLDLSGRSSALLQGRSKP